MDYNFMGLISQLFLIAFVKFKVQEASYHNYFWLVTKNLDRSEDLSLSTAKIINYISWWMMNHIIMLFIFDQIIFFARLNYTKRGSEKQTEPNY